MNIIMLRHGESEDNVAKVFGTKETVLSEEGIKQIKDIKETVRGLKFSKVYVSPLRRTKETLEYLELDMEGIEEKRIQEYDFGVFSGLTNDEIEKNYPFEYKEWVENPHDYIIREGESLKLVYERVVDFMEELIKQGEDVLLVTHAGIIRLVFSWVFDNMEYFFKFKVENGSLNIVSIEDNYKFIKLLNYKSPIGK